MVVATGFFDGVHIGHRLVISQLVEQAKTFGDESLVVTFGPIPGMYFRKRRIHCVFCPLLRKRRKC